MGTESLLRGLERRGGKNCEVLSFSSLLGYGIAKVLNFYIYAIFSALLSDDPVNSTEERLWKILKHSFDALAEGTFPGTNWDGTRWTLAKDIKRAGKWLANGFYCIMFLVRGDLDFFAKYFHLPHYGRNDPCLFCPAHAGSSGMAYTEFRLAHADWKDRVYTRDEWERSPWNRHPIFALFGVSILSFMADVMHCKHLGPDKYTLGSVLVLLIFDLLPGTDAKQLYGCFLLKTIS